MLASPDGTRIAYLAYLGTAHNTWQIGITDLSSGETRRWTDIGDPQYLGMLSWSADGRTLAFLRSVGRPGPGGMPPDDLRLLDTAADGDSAGEINSAALSPNGRSVFVLSYHTGKGWMVAEYATADARVLRIVNPDVRQWARIPSNYHFGDKSGVILDGQGGFLNLFDGAYHRLPWGNDQRGADSFAVAW